MNEVKVKLDGMYVQTESARAELGKPFPQEEDTKNKLITFWVTNEVSTLHLSTKTGKFYQNNLKR